MEFSHKPVMLDECLNGLNLKDGGVYVDLTIGGAGHSSEILARTKNSHLFGFDQDAEALSASSTRLTKQFNKSRFTLIHSNFSNFKNELLARGISEVDGILIDLGVSSYQLDNPERGFSFRFDGPLDMRMNQDNALSAEVIVNTYSAAQLKQIISDYGEERFASTISRHIELARKEKPIKTTQELKEIILKAVPRYKGNDGSSNIQRTFQAIRIEVNGELSIIKQTILDAVDMLKVGGRLAILTFHSLEDRIVKQTFKSLATNCTCPPEFPVCVCGGKNARVTLINSKPITASSSEQRENSRSTCAKLRVIEKIK